MESVFLKNSEEILYLVTGKKENLKGCLKEGFGIMDSTASEGAGEKHLPVVERDGDKITVKVGSVFHPMTKEHSITWIFLETQKGGQFVRLDPGGPASSGVYPPQRGHCDSGLCLLQSPWVLEDGGLNNTAMACGLFGCN